jgi:hypothetical protein
MPLSCKFANLKRKEKKIFAFRVVFVEMVSVVCYVKGSIVATGRLSSLCVARLHLEMTP